MYRIMSSENRDNFNSSFPIESSFIYFSCLIVQERNFNALQNSSGENGHSCLVTDLGGKVSSFSSFSVMIVMGFSYIAVINLNKVPSIGICLRFLV